MAARLREILGKDRTWQTAVVGAGRLGQAIMSYGPFAREGFEIAAVFDADPALVGREVGGHRIHGMDDLGAVVKEREILLGIPVGAAGSGPGGGGTTDRCRSPRA